jgi:predicted ATPase
LFEKYKDQYRSNLQNDHLVFFIWSEICLSAYLRAISGTLLVRSFEWNPQLRLKMPP